MGGEPRRECRYTCTRMRRLSRTSSAARGLPGRRGAPMLGGVSLLVLATLVVANAAAGVEPIAFGAGAPPGGDRHQARALAVVLTRTVRAAATCSDRYTALAHRPIGSASAPIGLVGAGVGYTVPPCRCV